MRASWTMPAFVAAVGATAAAASGPGDLFKVDGRRPSRAIICQKEDLDRRLLVDAPMAHALAGIMADLDRRALGRLLGSLEGQTMVSSDDLERFAVIHLIGRDPSSVERLVVLEQSDGSLIARRLGAPRESVQVELRREAFEALLTSRSSYRGTYESPEMDAGAGTDDALARPYATGRITLDWRTMKRRIYRDLQVSRIETDRDLAEETMQLRLCHGYTPRTPAGLVVWASPTDDGQVPAALEPALDALGFIAVGVDHTGNSRDVPDKFQLMLDSVATVERQYHIDRRRVYLVGLSGGGKVASVLTICFPEEFAGAVSIVGVASPHHLDERTFGDHAWRYCSMPRGETLRTALLRPLALMSGPADFNHAEMVERARRLEEDGFTIRFFESPGMGHEMPSSEALEEALRWADRPYQRLRGKEVGAAQMLLAAYFEGREDPIPRSAEDRAALAEVLRAGPWSPSAWRAIDLLRAEP